MSEFFLYRVNSDKANKYLALFLTVHLLPNLKKIISTLKNDFLLIDVSQLTFVVCIINSISALNVHDSNTWIWSEIILKNHIKLTFV